MHGLLGVNLDALCRAPVLSFWVYHDCSERPATEVVMSHWLSRQQMFTVALAAAVVLIWALVIYKVFLD